MIFSRFFEMLSAYDFIRYALLVGIPVTLCAALLGVTLVLRRFSMIGDGLSHIGFGALSVAAAVHWTPLHVAIPAVIAAAFFLLRGSAGGRKLRGDAAIALLSTSCLAIGMLVTHLSGGTNFDLMGYMFGSLFALTQTDVWLSLVLCAVVLPGFCWFFHRVFSITFDVTFARATGLRTNLYQFILAVLTALTIVLGMRMMGTLLISSLVIFPTLISTRVCKSFFGVTIGAAIVGIFCFLLGFFLSTVSEIPIPTGSTIVVVNFICFGIASVVGWVRSKTEIRHTH
ncbi:MAG: metal ABC transporter permease [Oscillospiraceae bacterium]|jgi:zinc transport system permease protein|nr:metal ABC transporter permease [Oscillospiraceae bacterium]